MNHANELNKLIDISAQRSDFKPEGFRSFEKESRLQLSQNLKAQNLFFSSSVLGMEAVSHVIEDQAIYLGGKFSFYADFQKFSRMKPQEERYRKLSNSGNPISIFGVPDTRPAFNHPNLKEVELDKPIFPQESNLAHNWFVVLNNPGFVSMALVANELPRSKFTSSKSYQDKNKLIYRNFEGFWTYDQKIINEVVNILEDYIKTKSLMSSQFKYSLDFDAEEKDSNNTRTKHPFKLFGR